MKRRSIAIVIGGVAAAAIFACSSDDTVTQPPTPDAGNDVVAPTDSPAGDAPDTTQPTADIQLLQISDWHGQVDPISEADANKVNQQYGGLGVLKAYFDKERTKNPNTLVFAAGDSFGGTPIVSNFFDDEPAVKGENYLGIAADTFGNHNLDRGAAAAKKLIDVATFPFVSTNLSNVAAELGPKVKTPYAMLETAQVKIAVLGITNPDAPSLVFPGRFGTMQVQEPVKAANDAAAAARAAGAHVVVCLVHMGATALSGGEPTGPALDFAQRLNGVDLVLADHTDVQFKKTIGTTLVVENRSKGRTYSRISVKVEKGKVTSKTADFVDPIGIRTAFVTCDGGPCTCPADPCPSTYDCRTVGTSKLCQKDEVVADPGAAALLKPYRDGLSGKLDVKIGTTNAEFPRGGAPAVERIGETPVGDLVADALLAAYRTSDNAQIAITNGGGLRDSLPAKANYTPKDTSLVRPPTFPADVTVGDAQAVLIFNNSTVVRKITGKLLWQALEYSVGALPAADGRFLQIAGFKFTFDRSQTPRVQSVTLDEGSKNIPSDDLTLYTVVTNDFTSAGGDGYSMLKETIPTAARDVMVDVLVDFIKKKGATALDPAAYPASTRIIDVTP